MDVVLDTNVLVAGLRSRTGASHQILTQLTDRKFKPLLSVPLFVEYEATLKRPEHLAASGLTSDEIDVVLDMVAAKGKAVQLHYLWRPLLRDPSDDTVAELAVAGRAAALVTLNFRDFSLLSDQFGIPVMRPGAFLKFLDTEGER